MKTHNDTLLFKQANHRNSNLTIKTKIMNGILIISYPRQNVSPSPGDQTKHHQETGQKQVMCPMCGPEERPCVTLAKKPYAKPKQEGRKSNLLIRVLF